MNAANDSHDCSQPASNLALPSILSIRDYLVFLNQSDRAPLRDTEEPNTGLMRTLV